MAGELDTVTFRGVWDAADYDDSSKYVDLTLDVLGMEPKFEKRGQDTVKNSGSIRASRYEWLNIDVNFAPFYVLEQADFNDSADYFKFKALLKRRHIYIISTTLTRPYETRILAPPEIVNLWDNAIAGGILPLEVEPVGESKSANYNNGYEKLKITFAAKNYSDIIDKITGPDSYSGSSGTI
ncbi:MAG: hypothetical protein ACLFQX_04145 [Candidatus Kapaibacterium sp.]